MCLVILLFYSFKSCFTWTTRCLCSSVCLPLVQFKEKTTQPWYLYRKCVLFSNKDKVQKKKRKITPLSFFSSSPHNFWCFVAGTNLINYNQWDDVKLIGPHFSLKYEYPSSVPWNPFDQTNSYTQTHDYLDWLVICKQEASCGFSFIRCQSTEKNH